MILVQTMEPVVLRMRWVSAMVLVCSSDEIVSAMLLVCSSDERRTSADLILLNPNEADSLNKSLLQDDAFYYLQSRFTLSPNVYELTSQMSRSKVETHRLIVTSLDYCWTSRHGFTKVHKLMEVWKIFKLLKIWKTYNEVGGVIMPYVLFVESGDCFAHFGCGTSRNLCTHFVLAGNGARNLSCYLLSMRWFSLEEERMMQQSSIGK
ncbi:hypothetical protein CFC21_064492 [Triticum aestivum]|uniref:Uncharacterized protein n=2 Tax=Triticum aestivum TaxID=4565 RepID=A0A9R1H2G7_WHEAT|nr:hypothetical protein CFC21_064492 [Triticum aestivum]